MKLKFGKYKGCKIQDVPFSYLIWLRDNIIDIDAAILGEISLRKNKALEEYIAENEKEIYDQDYEGEWLSQDWGDR